MHDSRVCDWRWRVGRFGAASALLLSLATCLSGATVRVVASGDTFLRADGGNAASNFGNAAVLGVGHSGYPNGLFHGLFVFDLTDPSLKGATIQSATLSWTIAEPDPAGRPGTSLPTLEVYELRHGFVPREATWMVSAAGMPWGQPGARDPEKDRFPTLLATFNGGARIAMGDSPCFFESDGERLAEAVARRLGSTLYLVVQNSNGIEEKARRNLYHVRSSRDLQPEFRPTLTLELRPGSPR